MAKIAMKAKKEIFYKKVAKFVKKLLNVGNTAMEVQQNANKCADTLKTILK